MAQKPTLRIGLNNKSIETLEKFLCNWLDTTQFVTDDRTRMERIDRDYLREYISQNPNLEHIQQSLDKGDYSVLSQITVPVVYPAVETGVAYQAEVFLSGWPIIAVIPTPQFLEAGEMMNTIIEDEQEKGRWVSHLLQCFRDGEMYNRMMAELDWASISSPALDFSGANALTPKVVKKTWEGNILKHLDLYNVFYDRSVPLEELCTRGEYAGYHRKVSKVELQQMIADFPNRVSVNIKKAIETSTLEQSLYHTPIINPTIASVDNSNLSHGRTDWAKFIGSEETVKYNYATSYIHTILYARVVPAELYMTGVPDPNSVQIWKFEYINKILVNVEPKNNVHNYLPIFGCHPNQSNIGTQNKSTAENATPFQYMDSILLNSVIATRRRAVADRGIFDPSRIHKDNINNPSPTAKIPLRPAAYGTNPAEAYYPIPFRDEVSTSLIQTMGQLDAMAQRTLGQNPARNGQFVKGNKTRQEFDTTMEGSTSRDQLKSLVIEYNFFTPFKYIVKHNIVQYKGPDTLFSRQKETIVDIDPVVLRDAVLAFKVSDGLTPASKLISDDVLAVALQTIQATPQIGAEYNVGDMFAYLISTKGAKLSDFKKSKEQIAYDQAVAAWQQAVQFIVEKLSRSDQMPTQENFPPQPNPAQFGLQQNGPPNPEK